MRTAQSKIVALDSLADVLESVRSKNKRIITTNGCFDILHWGHLQYLAEARRLGEFLVCGINSDCSVQKLKGPSRPLFPENTRALQVASLEAVDLVVIFDEETPSHFLSIAKPFIHTKGGDYRVEDLPERAVVEENGGTVVCLPFIHGFSTSEMIQRLGAVEK